MRLIEDEELVKMKREMEELREEEARLTRKIEKDRLNRELDLQRQKVRSLRGELGIGSMDNMPKIESRGFKARFSAFCKMKRTKTGTKVILLLLILGVCLQSLSFLRVYWVPKRKLYVSVGRSSFGTLRSPDVTCATASIQSNLDKLLVILKDPNDRHACAWIRRRVTRMWPKWMKYMMTLSKKQDMTKRSRRKVLLYLGFLTKKIGWGFAENQFTGAPLGEYVVWSDLIASLYLLGHHITVLTEFEDLNQHLEFFMPNVTLMNDTCTEKEPLIYTDIVGVLHTKDIKSIPYEIYKCQLRVLDSFGTHAAFNHKDFAKKSNRETIWGGLDLKLQQFYNMFPHTPDNTFLGFVMGMNDTGAAPLKKENIAVVYGKVVNLWKGKADYLKQFHDAGFEIHGTVHTDGLSWEDLSAIPNFVTNHGLLKAEEFHDLLLRAKLFIGLGEPHEGPAALEAIAHGCVFINPALQSPLNYGHIGKPTERVIRTQNPYIEHFVHEPYAYSVETFNVTAVKQAIDKLQQYNKFEPFLPYEYTEEGYLQRLNYHLEHQDFCQPEQPDWPPVDKVQILLGPVGKSCEEVCWSKDLICEPSHFHRLNSFRNFSSRGIKCGSIKYEPDIYWPGFDTVTNACVLQTDSLLYSCAGSQTNSSRLCPCRSYIRFQSALCHGCDI